MTLTPLCLPFLIGFLSIFLLLRNTELNYKLLLVTSLAMPIGFGIISLILFWSYAMGSVNSPKLAFSFVWLLFAALVVRMIMFCWNVKIASCWKSIPNLKSLNWIQTSLTALTVLFFAYCLWRYLDYFAAETTYNPFGGWDARYMWNIKARFYTRVPELWRDMFIHPKPLWTLPDYPHLLPGSVAWGWLSLGREAMGWPAIIGMVFFLSLVGVVIWFLLSRSSPTLAIITGAFLISIPTYQFWSATQYADVPLCFFITAASLVAINALEKHSASLSTLTGLLAGLAAWTKNEGVLFFVIISVAFIFALYTKKENRAHPLLILFFLGALIPIATVVYLKSQLGGAGIYIGSPRGFADYWKLVSDPNRILFILGAFSAFTQTADWLHLWQITGVAIVIAIGCGIFKKKSCGSFVFLVSIIAAMLAGYFLIYLITPIELKFHIQFTMTRLLLHLSCLALLLPLSLIPSKLRD